MSKLERIDYNIGNYKYRSASLIFYDKQHGFLICDEYRYREKNKLLHLLGGKYEKEDNNLFYTGIREFIEESDLLQHEYFNSLKLEKKNLTELIYYAIVNYTSYFDICINKENNLYHRYFITNISNFYDNDFKKNIINLPEYFDGKKTEIDKILWINNGEIKTHYNNFSWLIKIFFINIYKSK